MPNLPFTLSFSKLKKYLESPRALKAYIDGKDTASDAMNAGSLLDCLLFEPDTLKDKFLVTEKIRRAGAEWKAVQVEAAGRAIIWTEDHEQAQYEADLVRLDPVVKSLKLYENAVAVQELIDTAHPKYPHIRHKGVIDARTDTCVWDLKRLSRFDPHRAKWSIIGDYYHLQGRIYTQKYPLPFYNVVLFDDDVAVIKHSVDTMNDANMIWVKTLTKLNAEANTAAVFGEEHWEQFFKQGASYWSDETDGTFLI